MTLANKQTSKSRTNRTFQYAKLTVTYLFTQEPIKLLPRISTLAKSKMVQVRVNNLEEAF